ncbi:MAG: SCO family protein [Betaproteobacteria bacterium]|nr:SCO family protein [Betaproteobacteria bacterium]
MPDPRRPPVDHNKLLLAAAIGLVVWLVAGLLFAQELPAGTALAPRDALALSQGAIGRPVGDLTLRDAADAPVRLASLRDKPLVLQFVYTGCFQVCPVTTKVLDRAVGEAQRALGPNAFRTITVGFNLPFDTPDAMRDFQRRQGITRPNWDFLAADAATIDALARATGFAWTPTASGFNHLTQVTIVDAGGRVYRQVYGDAFDAAMLVVPLSELVAGKPASAPSLTELVERIRILCTVYDAREGRYRLDYALLIEIFVGFTVLVAILWYLAGEWRRQRALRAP